MARSIRASSFGRRPVRRNPGISGNRGGISLGWIVFLAIVALAWHFGVQAGHGVYGWFQMSTVLDEAIAVARISLVPSQMSDPRSALQTKIAGGALDAGVPLDRESLVIERSGEEVLVRVQWTIPLALRVELYRLRFEVRKRLPAGDPLTKWFLENPSEIRRPAPPPAGRTRVSPIPRRAR